METKRVFTVTIDGTKYIADTEEAAIEFFKHLSNADIRKLRDEHDWDTEPSEAYYWKESIMVQLGSEEIRLFKDKDEARICLANMKKLRKMRILKSKPRLSPSKKYFKAKKSNP